LTQAEAELNSLLYDPDMEETIPLGPQWMLLSVVHKCIANTIPYETTAIINTAFIKKTFPEEVAQVQRYYDEIQAMGEEGAFRQNIALYLSEDVVDWLIDAFGVNLK